MAVSPFYKILIYKNGRDISSLISRISYEDAVDVDNLLTMVVSKPTTEFIDDPDIKEGAIIVLQFGYIGGKISRKYYLRILDIMASYEQIIHVTMRATDIGAVMKKGQTKKVWNNVRSSDIANAIAAKNGLKAVIEKTSTVHPSLPQGGKSDYDFLKYLATLETNGSFRFYLKNEELHFTKRNLKKKSARVFKYKYGDGTVRSFKPYSQESNKDAAARDATATVIDPFTNTPKVIKVDAQTAKDDSKLGDWEYHYNFNSEEVGIKTVEVNQAKSNAPNSSRDYSFNLITKNSAYFEQQSKVQDTQSAGQHLAVQGTAQEGFDKASSVKKDKSLKDYMASLVVEGDVDYDADSIITMAGVAKKDTGNWYVQRVKFIITDSGSFEVIFTLQKNAGRKKIDPNALQQTDVNKTVGDESNSKTKKTLRPHYYDQNGNEIFKDPDRSFALITNDRSFFE